jgi:hypothetical protein
MIENLQIIFLIIAGLIGTAIAAILGYTNSAENFDLKKFLSSFIRGSLGIIVYIVGAYALVNLVGTWDYIEVALFAAGFEVIGQRAQGVLALPKTTVAVDAPNPMPAPSPEQIQAQADLDAATINAKAAAEDLAKATEAAKAVS